MMMTQIASKIERKIANSSRDLKREANTQIKRREHEHIYIYIVKTACQNDYNEMEGIIIAFDFSLARICCCWLYIVHFSIEYFQ